MIGWRSSTLLALVLLLAPNAAHAARVSGVVVDRAGRPIEYATVSIPVLRRGAATDTSGTFSIEAPDGPLAIECSQIGYEKAHVTVTVPLAQPLRIVLREEPVPVAEVVVAASSFGKTGAAEGPTLRRMDIVTTPGGAADVFQSLRALPSINAPDEGAALYVRGGDPNETLIRLDGGEIGHPYHYEGASGGLFSAMDSYMLKSAFFSSGGFSARYGGVMSGVLDIETQDPMNLRTITASANMVGMGVSTSWALVPDRLSMVGTIRGQDVKLLNRLYPSDNEYVSSPTSLDGALRLLYRRSTTGRLSLLYLGSSDHLGVEVNSLNYLGLYEQRTYNHLLALQSSEVVGGVLVLKSQLSLQRYRTRWRYGPADLDDREAHFSGNLDAVWAASARHEISFGGGFHQRHDDLSGPVPADSTDLAEGAPVRYRTTDVRQETPGLYLEDKARLVGPLYATVGARLDYASLPDVWTADPRAALAWRIDDHQTARVAVGRYHQPVGAEYLDPVYGNPGLLPMHADHVIAGYEWSTPDLNFRVEVYRKDYHDLVTQSAETFYANGGHGYARGVDVFLRARRGPVSGWLSYGYEDSRRQERDDPREEPSLYGVPHSATGVLQWQPLTVWQIGTRYAWSSGAAYTPVIGSVWDPARQVWHPIEGENQSARLPYYQRLDVRLTRLFSMPAVGYLPASSVCVAYIEGINVLDNRNLLGYVYNVDYSERYADYSYFGRRLLVAGFGLTW